MRRIIWACAVLASLWSALWLGAAQGISRLAAPGAAIPLPNGWQAEVGSTAVAGFPLRLSPDISRLRLTAPDGGTEARLPALPLDMPAYWPGHATLRLARVPVEIRQGAAIYTFEAEQSELAFHLRPRPSLPLSQLAFSAEAALFTGFDDPLIQAASLQAALRPAPQTDRLYDIDFAVDGLALLPPLMTRLGLAGRWPAEVEALSLQGSVRLSTQIDRHALRGNPPRIERIEIQQGHLLWGALDIEVEGAVDIAPDGIPEGELTLFAAGWRPAYVALQQSALALPRQSDLLLNALANISGDPETLDIALRFTGGQVSLGGIPLGPAPRFN